MLFSYQDGLSTHNYPLDWKIPFYKCNIDLVLQNQIKRIAVLDFYRIWSFNASHRLEHFPNWWGSLIERKLFSHTSWFTLYTYNIHNFTCDVHLPNVKLAMCMYDVNEEYVRINVINLKLLARKSKNRWTLILNDKWSLS